MVTIRNDARLPDRGNYYRSETKYLSQLVGDEIGNGTRDFFKALAYTNQVSNLGLDETDIEIIGRALTALSLQTRFAGTPGIKFGENAATHSLQMVNLFDQMIARLEKRITPDQKQNTIPNLADGQRTRSFHAFKQHLSSIHQYAGLAILLHDLGETLGEPTTHSGANVPVPDGFEDRVFDAVMKVVIDSVAKDETREATAERIHNMTETLGLEEKRQFISGHLSSEEYLGKDKANKESFKEELLRNAAITDEQLDTVLFEADAIKLPEADLARLNTYKALWSMPEHKGKMDMSLWGNAHIPAPTNVGYVGQLVKSVDHIQGNRHYVRFENRHGGGDDMVGLQGLTPDQKRRNLIYLESDARKLQETVTGEQGAECELEQALAMETQNHIYATLMKFVDRAYRAYDTHERGGQQDSDRIARNREQLEIQEGLLGMYEQAVINSVPAHHVSLGADWLDAYGQSRGAKRPSPRVSNIMDMLKAMASSEELAGKDAAWLTRMETRRMQSDGCEVEVA